MAWYWWLLLYAVASLAGWGAILRGAVQSGWVTKTFGSSPFTAEDYAAIGGVWLMAPLVPAILIFSGLAALIGWLIVGRPKREGK